MRIRLTDRYVTVLNLVLIAAFAYFAALSANDLISRGVTGRPVEPTTRTARHTVTADLSRASYSAIAERDVFNSVKQGPAPAVPVAANLHIKLLGTSQLTAAKPFAIVEDENNHRQDLYRLGEEIPDAGTLVAVEKNRALINHQGQVMSLEIVESGTPSVPAAMPQPAMDVDSQAPEEGDVPAPPIDDQEAVVAPSVPSPWKKLDNPAEVTRNMPDNLPARNSGNQPWGQHLRKGRKARLGSADGSTLNQ